MPHLPFYLLFSSAQLYISAIGGSSCTFALSPVFFEYTVELTYPTPEGLVGGFLTWAYNLTGVFVLFIFFIPNSGVLWLNFVLVIVAVGKHILPFYKSVYHNTLVFRISVHPE